MGHTEGQQLDAALSDEASWFRHFDVLAIMRWGGR